MEKKTIVWKLIVGFLYLPLFLLLEQIGFVKSIINAICLNESSFPFNGLMEFMFSLDSIEINFDPMLATLANFGFVYLMFITIWTF